MRLSMLSRPSSRCRQPIPSRSRPTETSIVSTRSARTFAVITVIATLIVGFLIGVVADRMWLVRHGPRARARPQRFMVGRIVKPLDRDLDFTAQPRAQVTQ